MPRSRIEPAGPRSGIAGKGTARQTKAVAPKGSSGAKGGKMYHRFQSRTQRGYK